MQLIHRHLFNISPINSNFQISSLADFCFLSINSGFSQETHLYSFETVSLRMDVCVHLALRSKAQHQSSVPDHATDYLMGTKTNLPLLSSVWVKEAAENFSSPCFISFIQCMRLAVRICPIKKQSTQHKGA